MCASKSNGGTPSRRAEACARASSLASPDDEVTPGAERHPQATGIRAKSPCCTRYGACSIPVVGMSRFRAIALALLAAGSALLACGGLRSATATGDDASVGGGDDGDASTGQVSSSSGSSSSSGGSTREGGSNAPPCPPSPPWPGQACAQVGQECDYSGPGGGYCGNVRAGCAVQGYWQSSGDECPAAGCPSALPASGQSCTQQDLRCRYPLNALWCDGGACAAGLTCGTLGCTNANDAVCDVWDCTCGGGTSWSCGAADCLGGDAGVGCDYDAGNDPRCPPAYSQLGCYSACAPVGLSCLYPGAGDVPMSNGCQSAASLTCVSNAREAGACTPCWDAGQWTCPTFDAGAGVAVGHWLALQ